MSGLIVWEVSWQTWSQSVEGKDVLYGEKNIGVFMQNQG